MGFKKKRVVRKGKGKQKEVAGEDTESEPERVPEKKWKRAMKSVGKRVEEGQEGILEKMQEVIVEFGKSIPFSLSVVPADFPRATPEAGGRGSGVLQPGPGPPK